MSADARYYYVDAQNQAAGPIAMAGLLALKAAGTVNDSTLVVAEGGSEWVAFSALKPAAASPTPVTAPAAAPQPATSSETLRSSVPATSGPRSEGGSFSSGAEPVWASQLTQKIEQLTSAMDKLVVALEKNRPAVTPAPIMAPATAALHAEKINLNPTPKPGIASLNPNATPGTIPRPTPLPAGVPVANPRPGVGTTLSPLAVPANAQKSALPLPALGKAPGTNPATPSPTAAPAKGNIFSKFLKK